MENTAARTLVGRNGHPDELGQTIVYLVANNFVTGTTLEVDGGLRLN